MNETIISSMGQALYYVPYKAVLKTIEAVSVGKFSGGLTADTTVYLDFIEMTIG